MKTVAGNKIETVWVIQGKYGVGNYGWEDLCEYHEATDPDAQKQARHDLGEYRLSSRGHPEMYYRIIKRREKV